MTSKGNTSGRVHRLRALARLAAQAKLNVADAEAHGRIQEAAAWAFASESIEQTMRLLMLGQYGIQERLAL